MAALKILGIFLSVFILVEFGNVVDCAAFPPNEEDILKHSTKIVGGRVAFANEIPYIVAISDEDEQFCGGSIYNEHFIITAAHCFDPPPDDLSNISVAAGLLDKTNLEEAQVVGVKKITVHEGFTSDGNPNDIAILELANPLKFGDAVQPIPVAPQGFVSKGKAIASGWGETQARKNNAPSGNSSNALRTVDVKIIARPKCDKYFSEIPLKDVVHRYENSTLTGVDIPPPTVMCAGVMPLGGQDACVGDSGGPLQCARKEGKVVQYLCGIVSAGFGCGMRVPGQYTDVAQFHDWIVEHTKNS